MAPQSKGVKNSQKKPLNTTKAGSKTPKNILVCCFITIRVPIVCRTLGGVPIAL